MVILDNNLSANRNEEKQTATQQNTHTHANAPHIDPN